MTAPSTAELIIAGLAALAGGGSCIAAVAAVVIAILMLRSAKTNNDIASSANRTADSMAQIERDRWHRELTPKLRITTHTFYVDNNFSGVRMKLYLDGPVGLEGIDQVAIRIRDDRPDRAPIVAGKPTAEQIANTVWGALRFKADVGGADHTGRTVTPRPLAPGECLVFALTKTLHPEWSTPESWHHDYHAMRPWVLRLAITCTKSGFKPWYFPVEIGLQINSPEPVQEFMIG